MINSTKKICLQFFGNAFRQAIHYLQQSNFEGFILQQIKLYIEIENKS